MDHSQKVFDHIRYNRLPLQYSMDGDYIYIDCSGWDIREIDEMIMVIGGKRKGFIVEIKNEDNTISN